MSDTERTNATASYLADAIGGLAATNAVLTGGIVSKWLLITEHEFADQPEPTLSIFRSDNLPPWDRLGLLRFAVLATEHEADDLYMDDEDDD